MSITLLHTADWQIGKQFGEILEDAGALVRAQRLETIKSLAHLARERDADAVLVAGDVFEMNTVTDTTLRQTVDALQGYAGPWLLLPGNHDPALAESAWTRLRRMGMPNNVYLLTEPEPVVLADGRLAVLPAPLQRRQETRDLTASFAAIETPAGAVRVGLAHGSVANRLPQASEAYNPIANDRADEARLGYFALGDWHGTLEIAPRTWYAGTPEIDRFKNNDAGNALIVTLDGPGSPPRVEKTFTTHYRWHLLEQRITGMADLELLETNLAALGEPWNRRIVRLTLTGTIDLETQRCLDEVLERWGARFRHLSLRSEGLLAQATDEDFDRLRVTGYLRDALERLREIQQQRTHPDHPHADVAMQRLYAELGRLEG